MSGWSKSGLLLSATVGLILSMLVAPAPDATAVTYGREVISPSSSAAWVVPIYWGRVNKKSQMICTGSLIDQQYVLTAAHCLFGLEDGTFSVQVGGDRLDQGRRIFVDGWWLNGRYSDSRFVNDVAILHLLEPANVAPVASLATSRKVPAKMRIYGWGLDQNGRLPGNLMYANVNRQIKTAKRAFGWSFKKRLMIAAGRVIKREGWVYAGGCNGDSGGPLVAPNSTTILGITAFGTKGCDVSAPTVFTKVAYYRNDITRGMQSALRMAQVDSQAPPQPTAPPTITGTVAEGGTATCTPGTWIGSVKQFTFDWTLGDYDDATGQSVTLGSGSAGETLTCTVTAVGSRGRTGKASASVVVSTAGSTEPGNANPTVSWSSPVAGSTITKDGVLTASASTSGSAYINQACLTINGQVPAGDYAYSYGLSAATWDGSTGCWTRNSASMNDLSIQLDPTGWTNGDYTFAWTVTDNNNRVSTTASRTFKKK